jgi:chromosome segregation ATPase
MWIWWIISLVVLIACFIFAYKVIASSYEFLPVDKRNFLSFKKNNSSGKTSQRSEAIWDLKNKLQKVEETSSFYEIQFSKMQERLKMLEASYQEQQQKLSDVEKTDEEDWKEMYYEENGVKEKLENELDITLQKLEEVQNQLNSIEDNNSKWISLQSDYDARLNELQSLQNNIEVMQRQLEAAAAREKELELSLATEIHEKIQYSNLESENTRLKSENNDLRSQVVEINKKEKELELGISRLQELESRLAIYEEEKAKMIANLEQMVNQNKSNSINKNSL